MSFPSDYGKPGPRPVRFKKSKPKKRAKVARPKAPEAAWAVQALNDQATSGARAAVARDLAASVRETIREGVNEGLAGAHDEEIRRTLRAFRADETDVRALGALIVVLWRTGLLSGSRGRRVQVSFRLRSEASKTRRRLGMIHPWPAKRWTGTRRGTWWTVGPGRWKKPDGRTWLMPCTDDAKNVWWNRSYCLPFASVHELVDYICERATEWRAEERTT